MLGKLLLILPLLVLPDIAMAKKGGGSDRDQVNRQIEAMMRDGRWERLIAEGRANRQAFEALLEAQCRPLQPTAEYATSDTAHRSAGN